MVKTLRYCAQRCNFLLYINYLNQKVENLKVLRRSPDIINNVKIGQGQLQLIMKQFFFNNSSNSQVISEKKMFRKVCGGPNEWHWIKGHRSA